MKVFFLFLFILIFIGVYTLQLNDVAILTIYRPTRFLLDCHFARLFAAIQQQRRSIGQKRCGYHIMGWGDLASG
jgi:hypothetical protein